MMGLEKMKKAVLFIIALTLILSLSGCSNPDKDSIIGATNESSKSTFLSPNNNQSEDTAAPQAPTERLGFSGGNIGVMGMMCDGGDGYIYYRSEADWRLYRAKPDGTEKTKICDTVIVNINVLDGWVYFIDYFDDNAIYRVRTDGTDLMKLADGYCGNLYVAESGIYFDRRDENNAAQVYNADLDGGEMDKIIADCYVEYYYDGKIYTSGVKNFDFGVFDAKTGEYKLLAKTYAHYVSVDESGIYYWAVNEGEYRCIDYDGGERVIVSGGDFYNYTDGFLYYVGVGENENGPCHIVYKMNVKTGEKQELYKELNEFFDIHGDLIGVTYKQMETGDYDADIFEDTPYGKVLKGGENYFNEAVSFVYVAGGNVYQHGLLRESIIQKGVLDCIARIDGDLMIWD